MMNRSQPVVGQVESMPDKAGRNDNLPSLVLTATIDPEKTPQVKIGDPAVRLRDYQIALRRWCKHRDMFSEVMLIENSGHPSLSLIREEFGEWIRIVALRDANSQITQPGKGLGEVELLRRALMVVNLPPDRYVVKCTGRLFVAWPHLFLRALDGTADIVINMRRDLSYADTRFFATRVRLLSPMLERCSREVDDARGLYLEHAMARASLYEVQRGARLRAWPGFPLFQGRSASTGRNYLSLRELGKWAVTNAAAGLNCINPAARYL
jgi:hypothetical protein